MTPRTVETPLDLDLDLDLDQQCSGAVASPSGSRSQYRRDAGDEYRPGRRFPYTTVGDWVALSGVSPRAIQAYVLLRSFVNIQRGDERAWPGQRLLARGLGVSKVHTVGAAIAELVEIGAVDVETVATATGRRNIYTVHEAPPDGYTGLASTQELAALVAAEDADAAAKALAQRPAGPPPPAAKPARSCPASNRDGRRATGPPLHDATRSTHEPAGQRGSAEKTADPPNGGPPGSLALGGYADFSADGSAEKSAQNDLKLNDPKGGGRERARAAQHPRTPAPSTPPQSPRPEPHPAPAAERADPHSSIAGRELLTVAGGAEAALVSELGAVTAALAQVAAQLTTALAAQPTAAPPPVALPAIADAPAPDRPDTWKCARHRAAPDPHDRPCRGCGTIRKQMQAQEDQRAAQVKQQRSETAQQARQQITGCAECDEYGYVLDPTDPARGSYDPPLRCTHDRPAHDRITEAEQRRTAQTTAAARRRISPETRALIDDTRTRYLNRTNTSTSTGTPATTGHRRRLNPKAWR